LWPWPQQQQLPAMYGFREFVEVGGLMSYATSLADLYRRAATHVDKIPAISGDLLSAVISIRYIFGFRKDNPNVFNSLIQSWLHF
jgi:hypothetical protein